MLTIILTVLADEDRLHRRLHVVVDATGAGTSKEGEGAFVRVEYHLLRLTRISPAEHHPAVAQADMRNLHGHRDAAHHNDLVAPIELVGFARRERQWNERPRSGSRAPGSRSVRNGARRRSHPRSPASAILRTTGSGSDALAPRSRYSPSASDRDRPSTVPAGAEAGPPARKKTMSPQIAGSCGPYYARSSGHGRSP